MTLYCIKCGKPSTVGTGAQEPCPEPCNSAVFVSTPLKLRLTADDKRFLRTLRIRVDDNVNEA